MKPDSESCPAMSLDTPEMQYISQYHSAKLLDAGESAIPSHMHETERKPMAGYQRIFYNENLLSINTSMTARIP